MLIWCASKRIKQGMTRVPLRVNNTLGKTNGIFPATSYVPKMSFFPTSANTQISFPFPHSSHAFARNRRPAAVAPPRVCLFVCRIRFIRCNILLHHSNRTTTTTPRSDCGKLWNKTGTKKKDNKKVCRSNRSAKLYLTLASSADRWDVPWLALRCRYACTWWLAIRAGIDPGRSRFECSAWL